MDSLQAAILGMIQGFTEFLPISSTGHLYLGRHLFGLDEAGLFLDTMLHVGTLLAVMVVYRHELLAVVRQPFGRLATILALGTIPAVVVGVLFHRFFDTISKTGITIGWEFLVTGIVLWGADTYKNEGTKELQNLTYTDAIIIGSFQAAAIMPALSRSGLTIAAAIFRGVNKKTAAHFSFLLSIPAIAGGVVMQSRKLLDLSGEQMTYFPLLVAVVTSLLCGYAAIRWMVRILQRGSLKGFAIYVFLLGLVILVLQRLAVF